MCREASFIVTKGYKCFWSKNTDSHSEIRREFGLPENGIGRITSVQVEIVPPVKNDFDTPIDKWLFYVDQTELPEWWDVEEAEKHVRIELKNWINAKVALEGETKEIHSGFMFATDGSVVKACGSSNVKAYGSSNVMAYDSSNVMAYGSSNVTACGSSNVTAYGSSNVKAYDSSNVTAYDSSNVKAYGSSNVMACGSSNVTAYGSSNVKACEHKSTVIAYCMFTCKLTGIFATLITKFGDKPKMFNGTEKGKVVNLNNIG